jgi:uncharacterized membrane protein
MVVANAYITDVFPPKERGPKFAQLGAMMMMALLIGPLSGAGLVALFSGSLRAPLIAATGMCTIAFALGSHYIVEPKNLRLSVAEVDKAQVESDTLLAAASDVKLGQASAEKDEKDASYNPWMSKFGLHIVGTVGTILFGACIFSLPLTPSIDVLIVLMPLIGIANGLQMNVSTIVSARQSTQFR